MPLFLKSIDPTIDILGNEQVLRYNTDQINNDANLLLLNNFAATANIFPSTNISFVTNGLKGFRFRHETYNNSLFGNFKLQTYDKLGNSTDIFKYDEQSDSLIFLKNTSLSTLSIANNLSLNSNKITSLANGIADTDAINLGQLKALGFSSLSSNGFLSRTANNTYVPRNITGGTNISITNGDGVNGNPIINLINNPVLDRITINNAPVSSTDGINREYIDQYINSVVASMDWKNPVDVATTANLTATYTNGTNGVGATLTNSGTQSILIIDGITLTVGNRVLVKNQTNQLQNGIYRVTNVGSINTNWVLTRDTDYDSNTKITPGNIVAVISGNIFNSTTWLQTNNITTIGTTSIIFTQFSYAATDFLEVTNNLSDLSNVSTARTNLGVPALTFPLNFSGDISASGALNNTISTVLASTINRNNINQVYNYSGSNNTYNFDITIPNSTNKTARLRLNRANTADGSGYEWRFYSPSSGLDTLTLGYNTGSSFTSVYSLAGNSDIFNFSSTAAVGIAKGNTAGRPVSATGGMFRFNNETLLFEGHNGTNWGSFATTSDFVSNNTFTTSTGWYNNSSSSWTTFNKPIIINETNSGFQVLGKYAYYSITADQNNIFTGTAIDGAARYSLSCNRRIAASEFNAFSSIKKKVILNDSKNIENEVLDIFKHIPLFKYQFKDKLNDGDAICYGVIAENLNNILPEYVDNNKYDFVPDVYSKANVKKNGSSYLLTNINLDNLDLGSKLIRVITNNKTLDLDIIKIDKNSVKVKSDEVLENDVFVYGTYSKCPTVSKQKLFELTMVVVQNLLNRVEKLENNIN